MTLLDVTIPGRPVPAARARVTKNGTFYPARVKAYRAVLQAEFRAKWGPKPAVDKPVRVSIGVSGCRASADTDNFAKAVLDSLQDAGVLTDDNVRAVPLLQVLADPDGEPFLRCIVSEFEGVA